MQPKPFEMYLKSKQNHARSDRICTERVVEFDFILGSIQTALVAFEISLN